MRFRTWAVPGAQGADGVEQAGHRSGVLALLGMLPFLALAVVVAVDLFAGPGVGFLPLLSLGPALAAASMRPAQGILVGGLATLLGVVIATYDGFWGSRRGYVALATIAGVTAAGAVASALRRRRERQLADVSAVAEAAQRVLLRPVPSTMGSVQIAVRYISATASARIGGDLYAVVATEGAVRLIVGDVQGKGLAAVQTAATVLGAFREAAHDAADLAALAERIEVSLGREMAEEEFVTAVLAQISTDGLDIEILNCGHPPPLLIRGSSGSFIEPQEAGLPLGLIQLAASKRKADRAAFRPGDRILFYTDGISEARGKSGDFYPLERCPALFDGLDPGAALDRLGQDAIQHVGHELRDDAAMLLIGRIPGEQWPASGLAGSGARHGASHTPAAAVPVHWHSRPC